MYASPPASGSQRPIFDGQLGDALELSRVVGHQRQAEAAGMGGDEEVVRSDHVTLPF